MTVASNIDNSLVSERWYFFLQLRIGQTDLFVVVPRNDAIFPKLHHTNRLAVTDPHVGTVGFAKKKDIGSQGTQNT